MASQGFLVRHDAAGFDMRITKPGKAVKYVAV